MSVPFERPVHVMLIWRVTTVRDAAHCLMSPRWPKHGPAVVEATRVLIEAVEGRADADEAHAAFVEAARESGVLVGD